MGISRRAYALHRGVSETAVRKALATGRIQLEDDGTIDPEKADAAWANSTDPSMQRGDSAPAAASPGMEAWARGDVRPVPQAAIDSVRETLEEGGVEAPEPEAGGQVSFLRARMANEVLKAQTAKVRLQKMKGELIDRTRATALVFDLARRERDAWIGWPARIAANMAAELEVDAHQMEQVLERYLRSHLAEQAEVKVELR